MGRIYLALQVDFDDDNKVLRLTRYTRPGEARACRDLLVSMWRYCKRERSDGHVPMEALGKIAYPDALKVAVRDADRLVECDLAERTQTGYFFPSYLKHNKSRAQLEAEAIKKAEAGKKGGLASGQVRKGEADSKQRASAQLRPSEAIDKDIDSDNDSSSGSLGGERPETLRAVPDPEPPRKATSSCTRHPYGNPTGEPCHGCRKDDERKQRLADREGEKQRLATEAARRDCTMCDGTGLVVDAETRLPTKRRCRHAA
jgi:hypothetical protein